MLFGIIIKITIVVGGIVLTIAIPLLLSEKVSHHAEQLGLINKDNRNLQDRLDNLLNWRDLITASLTGIFVLIFAAAEKITSTSNKLMNFIPLPGDLTVSQVAILMILLGTILIVIGIVLKDKLTPRHTKIYEKHKLRSTFKYYTLFFWLVVFWYILSFLFVFSSDR